MLSYDSTEICVRHDISRDENKVVGDESGLVDLSQGIADGRGAIGNHVVNPTSGAENPRLERRFDVGLDLDWGNRGRINAWRYRYKVAICGGEGE